MSKFFINRPVVAIVISLFLVILGFVAMSGLPVAQFPNIVPPEIQVKTTYTGADALTVEQSVATPIEQQMSGVDNMNYMYSLNANNGQMMLTVNFDLKTDPNTDQILTQMRESQAESQIPSDVRNYGVTVQKSTSSPLLLYALYSPKGTYDSTFLANYAYINLNDQLTRVKGIASITVFGAGQYAMRFWVNPDRLSKLGITIPEIVGAVQSQNNVNPAGQIGGDPVPQGQEFTYAVRAQGRLQSEEEFGQIVIRADPNGAMVRLKDVARIELGAQVYNIVGRFNDQAAGEIRGKPSAVLAIYQLPGTNAIAAAKGVKAKMKELQAQFPPDLEVALALDTTLAVTEGIKEIVQTLWEALFLVIIVVFLFLQGWRATLIPLMAVPVSLVGTFVFFPVFGFSVNTMSLFGLVLAIGLVVDDAIVVVEAVEHHIEKGLSPKAATLKAMEEVSGPVVAIAVILAAVFVPTAFIPGITGRLYQQFAVTIAISVIISAFNALTLSPALSALLLRPRREARGPLGWFFKGFNKVFGVATDGYVSSCRLLARKGLLALILLAASMTVTGFLGKRVPTGFLPEEDNGYAFAAVQLPDASSLQRTDEVMRQAEAIIMKTPGVKYCTSVVGYSMLSQVQNTYSGFFFISLEDWAKRKTPELKYEVIKARLSKELGTQLPGAIGFAFSPPAIPGIGTAGGFTFVLEDRAGKDVAFLEQNVNKFLAELKKRPEITGISTMFRPAVPQQFVKVDRDKVLKQGVVLKDVYQTLQCFMGGAFINYFNRFGRQWQVYVQAEGEFRTDTTALGRFHIKNRAGDMVPLSALTSNQASYGPEFTMRYNLYRSAQINGSAAPGYSSDQATAALEEVFAQTMPREMGFDYIGMSYQEQQARQGVPAWVVFAFSLLCVFLILAALYESWSLPFSVLLCTPIAVMGAFAGLWYMGQQCNIFAQIGFVMLIGLSAKNAILIVEFAKMKFEEGLPLMDAALDAARVRLRPILMTSFAFVLGCVPLALASGAGAISRQVMGIAVIGGMLAATGIAIFIIPALFYLISRISGAKHEATVAAASSEAVPAAVPVVEKGK
ncbi:MAG: multidrug efflux RND transporter permease subunit [Lentisphaeria bacterium]